MSPAPDAVPEPDDQAAAAPLVRPAERYGDDRRRWRPVGIVLVAGLAVLFVGGILALGWQLSHPPFTVQLRAYDVVDDRTVDVTYLVRTADTTQTVTCVVRARDRAGNEVGRTTSTSEPGRSEQLLAVTLRTSARAVLGEVVECRITP